MDLISLKNKLDEAEKRQNNLIGQQEVILKNLQELGFSSVEKAEAGLAQLETVIAKMETDLEKGINIFQERYADLLS